MSNPIAVYTFVDNNGGKAETRLHFPGGLSAGEVLSSALALASLFQAVSSATIVDVAVRWSISLPNPGAPLPGSSATRAALLFYRNGGDCATVRVPSPSVLLAETSGLYAGIRITRERLAVLTLLATVEALPEGAVDPLGRPYGTTFTVGGIVNL